MSSCSPAAEQWRYPTSLENFSKDKLKKIRRFIVARSPLGGPFPRKKVQSSSQWSSRELLTRIIKRLESGARVRYLITYTQFFLSRTGRWMIEREGGENIFRTASRRERERRWPRSRQLATGCCDPFTRVADRSEPLLRWAQSKQREHMLAQMWAAYFLLLSFN